MVSRERETLPSDLVEGQWLAARTRVTEKMTWNIIAVKIPTIVVGRFIKAINAFFNMIHSRFLYLNNCFKQLFKSYAETIFLSTKQKRLRRPLDAEAALTEKYKPFIS